MTSLKKYSTVLRNQLTLIAFTSYKVTFLQLLTQ